MRIFSKESIKHILLKRKEAPYEIDPDTPIIASQALFGLMIEIERVLKAHYIPTSSFVSDVILARTKKDELDLMIKALQTLQKHVEES